jgi:hypothetical protein
LAIVIASIFIAIAIIVGAAVAQTERYDDTFRKYVKRYFGRFSTGACTPGRTMPSSNISGSSCWRATTPGP